MILLRHLLVIASSRDLQFSRVGALLVPVLLALMLLGFGSHPALADGEVDENPILDHATMVAQAPGKPDGSLFSEFENNETVSLANGNLLVQHPSSPTSDQHDTLFKK